MPVESFSDLRCNIGEQERLVHGFLRGFGVCGRNPSRRLSIVWRFDLLSNSHVASIISTPEIVLELGPEGFRDAFVLNKCRFRAVSASS